MLPIGPRRQDLLQQKKLDSIDADATLFGDLDFDAENSGFM